MSFKTRVLWFVLLNSFILPSSFAFQDAAVLPKGVRRLMLDEVHTSFSEGTTSSGKTESLASPLDKEVKFDDFLKDRKGFERTQLAAFFKAYGIDSNDVVGNISADLKGQVDVYVPSFTWGITDRLSLGIAVPVYQAKTDVQLGFVPNDNANRFLGLLNDPATGQSGRVNEAVGAINNVVGTLNQKLLDNGYKELGPWSATGLGDMFVQAKYQHLNRRRARLASYGGLNAPTGRVDDPDNLTDIPFGTGAWAPFLGISVDEGFWGPVYLNQYAQYTAQLPARRAVRMKTADEPIAVEKKTVTYDLGDKIETGSSVQADTNSGLIGGLGYIYFLKFADKYNAGESSSLLEDGTRQMSHNGEAYIGYSSVKSYVAGKSAVPYAGQLSYQHLISSQNMPKGDRIQMEAKVYF